MTYADPCEGRICGEMQYGDIIHSDICYRNMDSQAVWKDPDEVKYLHDLLDEFLQNTVDGVYSAFYLTTDANKLLAQLHFNLD
jgi:hypothetical protein